MPMDPASTPPVSTPLESLRVRHARARVGTLLSDKWLLDELLGVGGMAAVYAATHRNGRRAALKILHPALSAVPEVRERFFDEAYAANRVAHPGTAAVLDDGVCLDGALYLVMDLLEGENLEARLTRADRGLPPAEVLALMGPLLEVLAAAHDRGILHRDIKPENVFLTTEGEIKLLDFGIARVSDSPRASQTRAGLTLGTPSFMPPEQARGRWAELDGRSDLWAAGATMFTLLTTHFVHSAETQNEALLAAMSHPAPPLRSVAPHVPACVAAIVDRALAFAREDRFPDARAMLRAVLAAQRTLMDLERRPPPHPRAGEAIGPLRFAPLEGDAHQSVTLANETPPRLAPRRRAPAAGALALLGTALLGAALLGTGYAPSIVPPGSAYLDGIDPYGFLRRDASGSSAEELDAPAETRANGEPSADTGGATPRTPPERPPVGSPESSGKALAGTPPGPRPRSSSDSRDALVCLSPDDGPGTPFGQSNDEALPPRDTAEARRDAVRGRTTVPRPAPPPPRRDPLARRK